MMGDVIDFKKPPPPPPPKPTPLTCCEVTEIQMKAYAAHDVLWNGTAPIEDLHSWVARHYGVPEAQQVFPLEDHDE